MIWNFLNFKKIETKEAEIDGSLDLMRNVACHVNDAERRIALFYIIMIDHWDSHLIASSARIPIDKDKPLKSHLPTEKINMCGIDTTIHTGDLIER